MNARLSCQTDAAPGWRDRLGRKEFGETLFVLGLNTCNQIRYLYSDYSFVTNLSTDISPSNLYSMVMRLGRSGERKPDDHEIRISQTRPGGSLIIAQTGKSFDQSK